MCREDVCSRCALRLFFFNPNLLHHTFYCIIDSFRNGTTIWNSKKKMCGGGEKKVNVNYRDGVKVKRRVDLFWVNYRFNFIPWQLQHLPLNWWKANHIVCSDLTFSLKAFECDSTLMNLCSSVIPSWRCTVGSQDWQLCCAYTQANAWWMEVK